MIQGILLILLVLLLDFLRCNPLRVIEQAVHSAFQLHCQLLSCRRLRHSISQLLVAIAPLQHASCCSHSLAAHLDFNGCPFLSQLHSRGFADTGIIESSGIGDAWWFTEPFHDLLIVGFLVRPDHQSKHAFQPFQWVDCHCHCLRFSSQWASAHPSQAFARPVDDRQGKGFGAVELLRVGHKDHPTSLWWPVWSGCPAGVTVHPEANFVKCSVGPDHQVSARRFFGKSQSFVNIQQVADASRWSGWLSQGHRCRQVWLCLERRPGKGSQQPPELWLLTWGDSLIGLRLAELLHSEWLQLVDVLLQVEGHGCAIKGLSHSRAAEDLVVVVLDGSKLEAMQ